MFASEDFSEQEKMEALEVEMGKDYSDVDELQKIKCLASLPSDSNKEGVWQSYVNNDLKS